MTSKEQAYWEAISTVIQMEMLARGKMSQAALAKQVGVGREAMNKYLGGRSEMPIQLFMRVADALGITPQWIFQEADRRMK